MIEIKSVTRVAIGIRIRFADHLRIIMTFLYSHARQMRMHIYIHIYIYIPLEFKMFLWVKVDRGTLRTERERAKERVAETSWDRLIPSLLAEGIDVREHRRSPRRIKSSTAVMSAADASLRQLWNVHTRMYTAWTLFSLLFPFFSFSHVTNEEWRRSNEIKALEIAPPACAAGAEWRRIAIILNISGRIGIM